MGDKPEVTQAEIAGLVDRGKVLGAATYLPTKAREFCSEATAELTRLASENARLRTSQSESDAVRELVERLREGVKAIGIHEDNNTELFDIEDANEAMWKAATALTRYRGEG